MSNGKTYEALQIIEKDLNNVNSLNEYIVFCKYLFKPKANLKDFLKKDEKPPTLDSNKIESLKKEIPFLSIDPIFREELNSGKDNGELFNFIKNHKSIDTTKDFPLAFLKEKILTSDSKTFSINNEKLKQIHQISGIITDSNHIKNLLENLPNYSFALWVKFKLIAPYFSKDDDEFYIIQNPVLKEKVFKVPMVRGSSWKGALAGAFKKLLNEENDISKRNGIIESYLRIFGAGSENIKVIEEYLREKSKNSEEFKSKILEFMLFELGIKVSRDDIDIINNENDENKLIELLNNKISQKIKRSQSNIPIEFQTHKGRAIFYPTYFDKLSLEIINPHDRRKRAGTNPIHYEVVPKNTEGILQILYIPFDGIMKNDEELKSEAKCDLENLCKAIEKLSDEGIGAKTKLGWGRFEVDQNNRIYCFNETVEIKGWKKC
ncbi:MAG: RAMP superfamily CRISPR-associated protein [bacterium]|nr:RAMP superfamily CRISPR-associated protein [bacterium]